MGSPWLPRLSFRFSEQVRSGKAEFGASGCTAPIERRPPHPLPGRGNAGIRKPTAPWPCVPAYRLMPVNNGNAIRRARAIREPVAPIASVRYRMTM